jgi:hypothetical protein
MQRGNLETAAANCSYLRGLLFISLEHRRALRAITGRGADRRLNPATI